MSVSARKFAGYGWMRPGTKVKTSPVILDFTGEDLMVLVPENGGYHILAVLAFDVTLGPWDLSRGSEDAMPTEGFARSEEQEIPLPSFHRIVSMLAERRELMDAVWTRFFETHAETLAGINRSTNIAVLTPISWEPCVRASLLECVREGLGFHLVEACSEALCVFFLMLDTGADRKIGSLRKGSVKVSAKYPQSSAFKHVFNYQVSGKGDHLAVKVLGWHYAGNKMNCSAEVNKNGMTFPAKGYLRFFEFLKSDSPRIDFTMDLNVGIRVGPDDLTRVLTPSIPNSQWASHAFVISATAGVLDIPLYAWIEGNKKCAFSLSRLVAPLERLDSPASERGVIIYLRRRDFGRGEARFEWAESNHTTEVSADFLLPMLYS